MKTRLYLLFVIVFSIFNGELGAQILRPKMNLDSLIRLNESYKSKDLKKLRLLNMLARDYADIDSDKGIEAADQAIDLALLLNNELEQAAALHYKASNMLSKGDAHHALPLFEQAKEINEKHNNQFGISENLTSIGNGNLHLSEYTKALDYFQASLVICRQQQNKIGVANNLGNIGIVYQNLSDYPQALEYHQQALDINQQYGNKRGAATNLVNIGNVYRSLSDYPKALESYKQSMAIFKSLNNKTGIAINLGNIGLVYRYLSNYPKALESQLQALRINQELGNDARIAINLGNIGLLYQYVSDNSKALEYLQRALSMNKALGAKSGIATNLGNIGNVYYYLSDYPKALEYFTQALSINRQLGNVNGIALYIGNIGYSYQQLLNYPKALDYLQQALALYEKLGVKNGIATNLINIGEAYRDAPDSVLQQLGVEPDERFTKSHAYLDRGLTVSKEIGDVSLQKYSWQDLSLLYEKHGDYRKAYEAYKNFITLRDSIESEEVKSTITKKEMQFAFDKKEAALKYEKQLSDEKVLRQQKELDIRNQALLITKKEKELQHLSFLKERAELERQNAEKEQQLTISGKEKELQEAMLTTLEKEKQLQAARLKTQQQEIGAKKTERNLFMGGTLLMLLLAVSVFTGLRRSQKEKKVSEQLRVQSDGLLHNILPEAVAAELKEKGKAQARLYESVTVLFTDFVNFTGISERLTPTELVSEINRHYTAFDAIMEKHGLEKIKTIGDAYLAVCGLPKPKTDHATRVINAALDILEFLKENNSRFQIRIGIHSGSVVAGIVGVKKFAYDIWGDAVNTAARMEQNSMAGKINISEATYPLVKDEFECEYRGEIEAKNKGILKMYFVKQLVTEKS